MKKKFSILAVGTTAILSTAFACGGDPDGKVIVPDARTGGDATGSASCFVEPSLAPTFAADGQYAETDGSGATGSDAHTLTWGGALNAETDILQLELYAGIGAFNGVDIAPKTVTLTGDELNYKTCSVCVRLFADTTQNSTAAEYFATGGTVTITSATGTLSGTMSNVTLEKVTVADDFTSTPVGDGCTTTITSAAFSATIEAAGSAAAGEPIAREQASTRLILKRHTR